MTLRSSITTSVLALAGFGLWSYAGSELKDGGTFDYDPNPLGIKRSPYGQVIAMAFQAPIDADFHGVVTGPAKPKSDDSGEEVELRGHDHGDHSNCPDGCGEKVAGKSKPTFIDRLEMVATKRTNPNPPTPAHKFYLRRQIENRLRFTYDLDPSHYGNYNSLYVFLTEPELGTKGSYSEGRATANKLALETLQYCLKEQNDPRPALTAATAAYNLFEGMILDPENRFTPADMRQHLEVMDFCLRQHFKLVEKAKLNGSWDLLSELRKAEILERSRFTMKMRETAEKGTIRRESEANSTANHESQ